MILANYPSRDGRLANGVGLDTPQSLIDVLGAMRGEGYVIENVPDDAASLMRLLQAGPTNAPGERGVSRRRHVVADRRLSAAFAGLPDNVQRAVEARWGRPEQDPYVVDGSFRLGLHQLRQRRHRCTAARAATTSIPRAPITIPIWCRRTIISPSISGSGATSTPTPSCISASTAISNGCRAKASACRRTACRTRCWDRCRISIPSSSTIPARAFRPSAARPPSSSII